MLGLRSVEPRSVRTVGRQEKFWATRGKRSEMFIKPNGLFQPLNGKRDSMSMMKPNGFFMVGKRSSPVEGGQLLSVTPGARVYGFKPNGIFASFDDKRSLSLKPNGLFTLTKKSKPFHKRYIKPNGFFSIAKRGIEDMEDYDMDYEGDLNLADLDLEPSKREQESLAPRSKMPEFFWATRG